MAWWIAGGIVVLALLALVLVLVAVLGSLRQFGFAVLSLNRRLMDGAQRLEPRMLELQRKAEALQGPMMAAQERAAQSAGASGAGAGGPGQQ